MPKVLIIEDDGNLRDVYKDVFELDEFTVETAKDGQEGVEKMISFLPDVVILDIFMPKMSGFDVLRIAKNDPGLKNIPVLVLTNINVDVPDILKNLGAAYFFLKAEVTPGQIAEKAKELIKHKA